MSLISRRRYILGWAPGRSTAQDSAMLKYIRQREKQIKERYADLRVIKDRHPSFCLNHGREHTDILLNQVGIFWRKTVGIFGFWRGDSGRGGDERTQISISRGRRSVCGHLKVSFSSSRDEEVFMFLGGEEKRVHLSGRGSS